MANERAWGAALQSLGGSVSDYYKKKMQYSEQEARDRRLAQAIIDKEIRDKKTAIEEEQRQAAIDSTKKYMEDRRIMREAQPGISYPTAAGPQSYLGPVMGPAIPAPTPYDYLGGFTIPETPAREVYPTEVPGIFKSLYGGRPTPGYRFAKPAPKPMSEEAAAREARLNKYAALHAASYDKFDQAYKEVSKRIMGLTGIPTDRWTAEDKANYSAWLKATKDRGITIADVNIVGNDAPIEERGFWASIGDLIGWKQPGKPAPGPKADPSNPLGLPL